MAGISSKKKGSKLIKDHGEDGLKKKKRQKEKERWPVRSKYKFLGSCMFAVQL